ncbi:tetratricopeptide repeat protein [Aggregatibacter kilianii]|uniref:tetratricopeptide repeat protein n=1 Tax=Aggregatibacter kilianii TaxID=2025884 RepID=UPI0013A625D4|nr:tetratricopeptide repeat protein [Aggregatibacter kilianii]
MKYLILLFSILFISSCDKNNSEGIVCSESTPIQDLITIEKSNFTCKYYLGIKYYQGKDIEKNDLKSFQLIKEAADNNIVKAKLELSRMYLRGIGTQQNYQLAFEWMESAANDGLSDAMNELGLYYTHGIGVKRDLSKTLYYYRQAAEKGNITSMMNLGAELFYNGTIENQNEAIHWTEKAAEMNDKTAILNLYSMYKLIGNEKMSMKWLNKGIELNFPLAFFNLGYEYSKGNSLLRKDDSKAFENYLKAAEMGVSFAQNNLANWYLSGYYVQKDEKEAIKWYSKAADNNLPEAMYALYQLYSKGTKDIPQDLEKANYWLEKAKQNGFVPPQ